MTTFPTNIRKLQILYIIILYASTWIKQCAYQLLFYKIVKSGKVRCHNISGKPFKISERRIRKYEIFRILFRISETLSGFVMTLRLTIFFNIRECFLVIQTNFYACNFIHIRLDKYDSTSGLKMSTTFDKKVEDGAVDRNRYNL